MKIILKDNKQLAIGGTIMYFGYFAGFHNIPYLSIAVEMFGIISILVLIYLYIRGLFKKTKKDEAT